MRAFLKFPSVAVLILLAIMALGPEQWQPRRGLGWEFDHFFGYGRFAPKAEASEMSGQGVSNEELELGGLFGAWQGEDHSRVPVVVRAQ
jgi:hypothetical protein